MARDRTIPADFWTLEAVIDCTPMTRLLFIGLWNFADDFGVQPLKPRTIRLQVFPGDAIDNEAVRAMIDELAAQGLVRPYTVDGVDYLAIVDWEQFQRVGRNARRRYPAFPSPHAAQGPGAGPTETGPGAIAESEGLAASTPPDSADGSPASPSSGDRPPSSSGPSADSGPRRETDSSTAEPARGATAMAYPHAPDGRVHAADS
jgi:hypothetical protein